MPFDSNNIWSVLSEYLQAHRNTNKSNNDNIEGGPRYAIVGKLIRNNQKQKILQTSGKYRRHNKLLAKMYHRTKVQ